MCDNSMPEENKNATEDSVLVIQGKAENDTIATNDQNLNNTKDVNSDFPDSPEIQRELDSGFCIIRNIVKQNKLVFL